MALPNIPVGIETRCNGVLDGVVSQLATLQSVGGNGRFWQGARTHATAPSDGNKSAPNLSAKPTDGTSWSAKGVSLPASMEIAVEVHEYQGPMGPGYRVIGLIEIAGQLWKRAIDLGPEGRSHDWVRVNG